MKARNWLRGFLLVSATTPLLSVLSCGGGETPLPPKEEPKPPTAEELWDRKVEVTTQTINDNFDKYYKPFYKEKISELQYNPGEGFIFSDSAFSNNKVAPRDFALDQRTIMIGGYAFRGVSFFPGYKWKLPEKTYIIWGYSFAFTILPKPFFLIIQCF